jgi:hypothetical protein
MSRHTNHAIICHQFVHGYQACKCSITPDYTKDTLATATTCGVTTANHSRSPQATPAWIRKKLGICVCQNYSDGGCEQHGETVEEIEVHE